MRENIEIVVQVIEIGEQLSEVIVASIEIINKKG